MTVTHVIITHVCNPSMVVLAYNAWSGHEPLLLYTSVVSEAFPLVLESMSLLLLWIDLQSGCIPMSSHRNTLTHFLLLLVVELYLSAEHTFFHYCSSLQTYIMLLVGWVSACSYVPSHHSILVPLQQNTLMFWCRLWHQLYSGNLSSYYCCSYF